MADDEPRKVEMIRVPREEEYFDREAVLGRDATSVFPREAAQLQDSNRDALVEALGARKFISETEVGWAVDCSVSTASRRPVSTALKLSLAPHPQPTKKQTQLATIKSTRGGTVDDGSVAADKPLAVLLAERKAEKDAAFQEQWKQMKTGARWRGRMGGWAACLGCWPCSSHLKP
jgi:hypothetical protein